MLTTVVVPAISRFLREQPEVQLQCVPSQTVRSLDRFSELVQNAEVDFLIAGRCAVPETMRAHALGAMELVLIQSTKYRARDATFLDTRPEDPTTSTFLRDQKKKTEVKFRTFLHDEEGILNGVAQGLGRGVVFRKMISKQAPVELVTGYTPQNEPLYLYARPPKYASRLQKHVEGVLLAECAKLLT